MTDSSANAGAGRESGERIAFPKNAVIGIVNEPRDVVRLGEALRGIGVEPEIYCGESAAETIQHEGHPSLNVQGRRVAQKLFGFEAEHADRHMAEVEAGNFVVVAPSRDDKTTDRIADAFAANGGHFVNYYTSWTGRPLLP